MQEESDFLRGLSEALDRRREQITHVCLVVRRISGQHLKQTAALMALPLLYANWEGFVKESLQSYVSFIERQGVPQKDTHPAILSYSWAPSMRKLKSDLSFQKQLEVTQRLLSALAQPVRFEKTEKEIDTKSNLKFEVLEDLFRWLHIDVNLISDRRKKINSLVEKRNHIAHGGRQSQITREEVDDMAALVVKLMEEVEQALQLAVKNRAFRI